MIPQRARATLVASCVIHFLHDGCSDLLYALFPVWAREFSLSLAQVGLLRTGYSGALALFQVPAGYLADRWGEPRILAAGTFLTAVGFFCVGTAGGFVPLLVFLMIGGLGSLPGAVIGGLALGVLEAHSQWFLGPQARDLIAYLLLFVLLAWRPRWMTTQSAS